MNGTYSQTGDAATPPVVCNAKKMQCQQQRRRQEKSVKIMQFMRYTWQEEQRFLAGTRTQGLTKVHRQTERKREREAATHLAPVALRAAWQYIPLSPLSLSLLPSAAAHLIFGNINLLTTYTTCCAAMRRFCCFCHVFSPSLSLFARNRTAPAAAVAAVYVASIAPKIGSTAAAAAAANKMY